MELLNKASGAYFAKDVSSKIFQVSPYEQNYASSGVVLASLAIEAYRNKIFYHDKLEINAKIDRQTKRDVAEDLANLFQERQPSFPSIMLKNLLKEVFILRDCIVHNHIYEVTAYYDSGHNQVSHSQRLLKGYGYDKKRRNPLYVKESLRKTRILNFNLQPLKIGFEDLFTLLHVIDMLFILCQQQFGFGYVPYKPHHMIDGIYVENLSHILAHYYPMITNTAYLKRLRTLTRTLRDNFEPYAASNSVIMGGVPHYMFQTDTIINNFCPACGEIGYRKPGDVDRCAQCGHEFSIT